MALNFTGRAPAGPEASEPAQSRGPVVALAIFGVAAMLAGVVLFAALRQHRIDAPPPLPPLMGADQAVAAEPAKPAVALAADAEPAWIMHKAAPTPRRRTRAPRPLKRLPAPAAPAKPSAPKQDPRRRQGQDAGGPAPGPARDRHPAGRGRSGGQGLWRQAGVPVPRGRLDGGHDLGVRLRPGPARHRRGLRRLALRRSGARSLRRRRLPVPAARRATPSPAPPEIFVGTP
ncbi:MAG: hypothetical protein WDN45_18005 [Caulobacteraceae bacterium]